MVHQSAMQVMQVKRPDGKPELVPLDSWMSRISSLLPLLSYDTNFFSLLSLPCSLHHQPHKITLSQTGAQAHMRSHTDTHTRGGREGEREREGGSKTYSKWLEK